jgi:hypothetical protein
MARRTTISDETTGGNVFADLCLPRPEQELLKAGLTLQIYRIIKARHLTPAEAGKILTPELTSHETIHSGLTQAEACGLHPARGQLK